jgi:hypothetical protein
MRCFRWLISLMVLVGAQYAGANSIDFTITRATVFVGIGSDNAFFSLTGPGISITGSGGIVCQQDWCAGQVFASGPGLRARKQPAGGVWIWRSDIP